MQFSSFLCSYLNFYFRKNLIIGNLDTPNLFPSMAEGLPPVLTALPSNRQELNDSQYADHLDKEVNISCEKNEQKNFVGFKRKSLKATKQVNNSAWSSAPMTCFNLPDPKIVSQAGSSSEPTSLEYKTGHFIPGSVKDMDSPTQILSKFSECGNEIISSSNSIDVNNIIKDSVSELRINDLKISHISDSKDVAESIGGGTSYLELHSIQGKGAPEDKTLSVILENKEMGSFNLPMKFSQLKASKEKIKELLSTIQNLNKRNDQLKEHLRRFISNSEIEKDLNNECRDSAEIDQYDKELVQVADVHAKLVKSNTSIDRSTSCLEPHFTEDQGAPEDNTLSVFLDKKYLNLQNKFYQMEEASKENIKELEIVLLDLNKENYRLRERLRQCIMAVKGGEPLTLAPNESGDSAILDEYERKVAKVAEIHDKLSEFNKYLQQRLKVCDSASAVPDRPESNVKAHIPRALLVEKRTHTYHVYEINLKVGQDEWAVCHRYSKFHELHKHFRQYNPDIASYKFPSKKKILEQETDLAGGERLRVALELYLRHILSVLPELRDCTKRAQLITLQPFFGTSSTSKKNCF